MLCGSSAMLASMAWIITLLYFSRPFQQQTRPLKRRPTVRFTNSCGLGLANVKVNLLETIAFDCNVGLSSIVGACRPPASAMQATKERWCEAEAHRGAGDIALKSPQRDVAQAQASLQLPER